MYVYIYIYNGHGMITLQPYHAETNVLCDVYIDLYVRSYHDTLVVETCFSCSDLLVTAC